MTTAQCSVVIATLDRAESVQVVLGCLQRQTRPPLEIIISAAGNVDTLAAALASSPTRLPVTLLRSSVKSSAMQRNQSAAKAVGEVIAFLDDDIELAPDLFEQILDHFDRLGERELGGISPRISNMTRETPGRLTRLYYALQSGYDDEDYGGKLFGPGINCGPVFSESSPQLVASDWLPSTCLFMRTKLFRRHLFPEFSGYSFAEDVHLTARAAHEAPLYFCRDAEVLHHSLPSEFKADRSSLAAGKLHNMAVVAREAMGMGGWPLWWRWHLHRVFVSAGLFIRRPAYWQSELLGVWRARP